MSAAARAPLFVTTVLLISLIRTWALNSSDFDFHRHKQQRSFAPGLDKSTSRSWSSQSSHTTEHYGFSQAIKEDSPSHRGQRDEFRNIESDIHVQTSRVDLKRPENREAQLVGQSPWSNSNVQKTAFLNSYAHQELFDAARASEPSQQSMAIGGGTNRSVTTNSSSSRTNKQSLAAVARSELHAVSRGNRRVAMNSALNVQTLSNSNEGLDKSDESIFSTSFPKVSFSGNSNVHEGGSVQNYTRNIWSSGRNQSQLNLMGNNGTLKQKFSTETSSENNSEISDGDGDNPLPAQGRIVTPSNIRVTQPGTPVDVRKGILAAPAGLSSSSEFKGDSGRISEAGGGAIVFPDTKFKPRVTGNKPPACAQGSTFCTDVENYPLPHLSNVLKNEVNFREYYGVDKDDIRHRVGPVDGDPLCNSQEKLIFPKMAQNKDDEWMFIVNLDKEYIQGVRIEVCEQESSPCQLSEGFPPGYSTHCRQKYIYRKLLAVTDDGKPAPDSFKLPSCCACYYVKTVGNRILSLNNSANSKAQG